MYQSAAMLVTALLTVPALAGGGGGGGMDVALIHDTEFADSDWSAIVAPGATGGFSFSAGHVGSGGFPGAYRLVENASATSPAAGANYHTHRHTWTPLLRGPILSVDMAIDVNCFNGGTSNAVAFGLMVLQGGTTYIGPTFTALTDSGWRSDLHGEGLTALSFTGPGGTHPDFGPTAGVTAFGFYTSNGTASGQAISSQSGVDNFIVTITSTPELVEACTTADVGRQGGLLGADGRLDNNDFISFINLFFVGSMAADLGRQGGFIAPDGMLNNNDFIAFIDEFFAGC
ncbi:MAG: GC-type dockerin domain-anchored protein [Phycisphaerales bacterium]